MQLRLLCFLCILTNVLSAQHPVFDKAAYDAYLITRVADKYHIKTKPVDDTFSAQTFNLFLNILDRDKLFFSKEDIKSLEKYYFSIDDEIKNKRTGILQQINSIYTRRLNMADTMVLSICKQPFNFKLTEFYTEAEDTSYAANEQLLRVKLYKNMKLATLQLIADYIDETSSSNNKKTIDSLEQVYRKRVQKSFHRFIERKLQGPGGIQQFIADSYCNAVALCYDPHTQFMSKTDKENFETELGNRKYIFGFSLDEDDEGKPIITKLLPGSPAFNSGLINEGDKLISIQWENSQPIDVTEASLQEIFYTLSASNHDKAIITIKKQDGSKREVVLNKTVSNTSNDDDKVKSFILGGTKKIGYISLPSFYEDWENEVNINGCANDVAKEILKLKKDNIEGLILDLRYNTGGSVLEALELTGIFIDAGPVAVLKTRQDKPLTLKDANRGTIYDGPLIIMVNGYSASASELLAGCLQDYNRALIVGSNTYGKGTGQSIIPLDTTINLSEGLNNYRGNASSFIKLTISQLFRISGSTAQFKGIEPDIVLPDITQSTDNKEKNELYAIPPTTIEANKYYKALAPLNMNVLKSKADELKQKDSSFLHIQRYNLEKINRSNSYKSTSLKLDEYLKNIKQNENAISATDKHQSSFKVDYNTYEKQLLPNNQSLKEQNEFLKTNLENDIHLNLVYQLIQFLN